MDAPQPIDGAMTQYVAEPGVIDFSWGHPDPSLLPVRQIADAARSALSLHGQEVLAYGAAGGPPSLKRSVRARLAETDARAPSMDELVITSGASQSLDLLATLILAPGDTVLVDVPTYHLAIRVLQDHPIRLAAVASDTSGISVASFRGVVRQLRKAGHRPTALYTIPTYHNPTGRCLTNQKREALVHAASELGVTIIEDDTYRELCYDGPPPASLWSLAPSGLVVRIGTFAKSVAPGLRVGYVTADSELVRRIVGCGLLDSGGGSSHFAAAVLAEYFSAGHYAPQVALYRAELRRRRDGLLQALADHIPSNARWTRPKGGYFVWISLDGSSAADQALRIGLANGVSFIPSGSFYHPRREVADAIRLSFSMLPLEQLALGAERLGSTLRQLYG